MKKKGMALFGILAGVAIIAVFLTQGTGVFAQQTCDFSGTTEPVIKGNVSDSGLIYHVPGGPYYDRVSIEESKGERLFCTEQEAVNAGWRPTERRASQGGVPEPEPTSEPQPSVCDFSVSAQPLIKGNVSSGGLIYHVPGDSSYSRTIIDPEKGEQWFCQEREALRMNWRPTQQRVNRAFSHTFQEGDSGPEVRYLQVVLNWLGFTVAEYGPGSPGNETDFFGPLTKAALQRFQEARVPDKLLPAGIAGPLTRAKLAQLLRVTPNPAAPIDELYDCIGGNSSWLGPAASGPYTEAATGKPRQDFQYGYIAWNGVQFYTFSNRAGDTFLAPLQPVCVVGLTSTKLDIAKTYNRIGAGLETLSTQNTLEIEVALAVWQVETGSFGEAYGTDGKLNIRFENHIFWDEWGSNNTAQYWKYFSYPEGIDRTPFHKICETGSCGQPNRNDNSETNGWILIHPYGDLRDQPYNHAALTLALNRLGSNKEAAYRSMSMGGPQIMGFNHSTLGYLSAEEMYQKFLQAEFNHVKGFFDFLPSNTYNGQTALFYAQQKDFEGFAGAYNGPTRIAEYAPQICDGYNTARQLFEKSVASC